MIDAKTIAEAIDKARAHALPGREAAVVNAVSATVREEFMKAVSGNPRWKEAPKSGSRTFMIVGAKR